MTLTALALTVSTVALADDSKPDPPPVRIWVSSAYQPPERCPGAQKAVGHYRRSFTSSRTAMGLAGAPPRAWYPCDAARRRAVEWRARAHAAAHALAKVQAHRNVIIRRLNRGLANTPMRGLGQVLEQEARATGISPYFIAAAAGTESSFGAAPCSSNPRNVWGLSSCGSGWHVPYFHTWRQAIRFYARFLAARWPHATSPYHFYGYAACDACWGRKTSMWMRSRFGVDAHTRYHA